MAAVIVVAVTHVGYKPDIEKYLKLPIPAGLVEEMGLEYSVTKEQIEELCSQVRLLVATIVRRNKSDLTASIPIDQTLHFFILSMKRWAEEMKVLDAEIQHDLYVNDHSSLETARARYVMSVQEVMQTALDYNVPFIKKWWPDDHLAGGIAARQFEKRIEYDKSY